MSGQKNPETNAQTAMRGLRLVKGGRDEISQGQTQIELSAREEKKRPANPLVRQLAALSDAIDRDVAQLLNL
jgi:hypothetical protein